MNNYFCFWIGVELFRLFGGVLSEFDMTMLGSYELKLKLMFDDYMTLDLKAILSAYKLV